MKRRRNLIASKNIRQANSFSIQFTIITAHGRTKRGSDDPKRRGKLSSSVESGQSRSIIGAKNVAQKRRLRFFLGK